MNLKRLILIVGVAALLVSKVSAVVICGQPTPEGPTSPPSCPGDPCSKNGGGSGGGSSGGAASCPSKGGVNSFDAQTGNVWRQITDFQLFGVGAERLAFWRLTTSRYEGALPTPLGTAGNWRHSYYWNIYYDGTNSLGLESIHIDYPWGGGNSFDKKTPEDIYMTTASAVTERIEPPAASTNEYSLWF